MKYFDKNWTIFAIVDRQTSYQKIRNYLRFGITDLFLNVEIETSSKCNRKCGYCPNSLYSRGTHYMSEKLFKLIINQLKELRFEGNIRPHFYNEPLLDPRLPDLLRYASKTLPKVSIHLYSNGDFLTHKLFKTLISSGVSKFIITSHSGFIHKELQEIMDTPQGKQYIHQQFITKDTLLWNRGGTVNVHNMIKLDSCPIPTVNLTVNYKGEVVLCCNDALSQHVMGNLNKEKIVEIWRKPYFRTLRKNIIHGKFDLEICRRCTNRLASH